MMKLRIEKKWRVNEEGAIDILDMLQLAPSAVGTDTQGTYGPGGPGNLYMLILEQIAFECKEYQVEIPTMPSLIVRRELQGLMPGLTAEKGVKLALCHSR